MNQSKEEARAIATAEVLVEAKAQYDAIVARTDQLREKAIDARVLANAEAKEERAQEARAELNEPVMVSTGHLTYLVDVDKHIVDVIVKDFKKGGKIRSAINGMVQRIASDTFTSNKHDQPFRVMPP